MKRTILIAVIIIGFGGAVVMGIMAVMNSSKSQTETTTSINVNAQPVSAILPEGTSLDFEKLEGFNRENRFFPFPEVLPTEVGANLGNIIE